MRKILIYLVIILTALGCTFKANEPREPHWHKENCAHCRMALSERRFAAQILTPQGSRYYDDLGCAVLARDQDPELKKMPLYVVPDGTGAWQKAETVRYRSGLNTPMGSGFGAVANEGMLKLDEVQALILNSQKVQALHQGARHD